MYVYYNPNPYGRLVGDCVVRAVSKVTGQSWDETYIGAVVFGFEIKNMPSGNEVWGEYLKSKGFVRTLLPDRYPSRYTVRQFCEDNPYGVFLLATGSHAVAVVDGDYYDAWDSGDEVPMYYWSMERS